MRSPRAVAACNSGTITTSNSRPLDLWMVINCTPQSLLACGVGQGGELVERRIERGAEQVRLAVGQPVQAAPEQSRGWRGRCHPRRPRRPAAARPVASQVPSEAVGWAARRAGAAASACNTRAAAGRPSSLSSGNRSASNSGTGRGSNSGSSAGKCVQVVEREAAPRRAQNAQPGHAVLGIEQSASQRECVEHFGARRKLFQFDGAEGNSGLAQRLGDRHKMLSGAAQDGDAVFFSAGAGLLDAAPCGCG